MIQSEVIDKDNPELDIKGLALKKSRSSKEPSSAHCDDEKDDRQGNLLP